MTDSSHDEGSNDPVECLLAQQRKEKKALKEKTLAMKKTAKSGNKQKQKETSAEIERLEREMAARHEKELADLKASQSRTVTESSGNPTPAVDQKRVSDSETDQLEQAFYKEVKVSSRNKKKQVRSFGIVDIAPDGDCLYNAVANQLQRVKGYEQVISCVLATVYHCCSQVSGKDMRRRAAKYIREHKDDFIPFLVNESDGPLDEFEFDKYCHGVENESKDGGVWGGEPELNALSQSLERSIELIQPIGSAVIFGEEFNKTKPLIIVYHRHAYELGAHYNSTAVKTIS
ncbi:unnamed protein product [Nippostrongylus brasiliensis]|uniref:OTU domain-containing protein n=1 Tax=Nippostrongylus brasiliensis TaxID=27835 RepID=A0A0N4Y821_NIPBR|nr:unnamed protein product [Nippostrongylus brasiliensis]